MICRIQEKYFSFADDLNTQIEQKLGGFLQTVGEFLEKSPVINKNFDVYIRESNKKNPFQKEYYFMLELDSHTLLDVYGQVEPQTGTISNLYLRATIPFHETWKGEQFEQFPLTEIEQKELLQKQVAFSKNMQKLDVSIVMDIDSFNPEPNQLPEAVVNLETKGEDFFAFIEGASIVPVLETYYGYVLDVKQRFEQRQSNK